VKTVYHKLSDILTDREPRVACMLIAPLLLESPSCGDQSLAPSYRTPLPLTFCAADRKKTNIKPLN
jgi:hypothetical protein